MGAFVMGRSQNPEFRIQKNILAPEGAFFIGYEGDVFSPQSHREYPSPSSG